MKYDLNLPFAGALPDAPLAMPKQRLERQRSLMSALKQRFAALAWF